jgi:hypothetical protein
VEHDGDNQVVQKITLPMTFALIGRDVEALAQSVGLE